MFDNVVDPLTVGPRERYEAIARSVRDVLSQRWLRTGADLRAGEPQARLLPVDGVPDRSLADEQRHQPPARSGRGPAVDKQAPRPARDPRAGARRRPRQRRARPARGVLPRFDGDAAAPGHGLRPALRVRHLQADDRATVGSTSSRIIGCAGPIRGRSRGRRSGRGPARLLVRRARRQPGRDRQAGHRR